mmetsp:Transcript_9934/g.27754  ORF Transcript_9934/g.27754 Transcript_9934/m.27754 type:complete len:100 (+) Transcript_9934:55-354(+)
MSGSEGATWSSSIQASPAPLAKAKGSTISHCPNANQHPLPQMECRSSELTKGEVVQNLCPKLRETVQWQMSKKDEKKSAESRDVKPLKNGESPVDETSS